MTERITSSGSPTSVVTSEASRSLSPNLISRTLTVSFSLTIGTAPNSNSVLSVLRMLR